METPNRRFGKLPDAIEYSGLSRARLYQLAGLHPGLFRKNGSAVLVDFRALDQILDNLPAAKINVRPPRRVFKAPDVTAA